jgi:hypothetical protein
MNSVFILDLFCEIYLDGSIVIFFFDMPSWSDKHLRTNSAAAVESSTRAIPRGRLLRVSIVGTIR